MLYIFSI